MTNKPTPTDAEILDAAEDFRSQYTHGGTTFDEFDEIGFTRAVLAKWGRPAQAGEPFGYFHQLLNHEGKGNGVWLGAAERKVVEQAHTPGETSEEIVALYTTPQPPQAADSVQEDADRLKEVVGLLEELAEHDNYHAEYDGRMITICPECSEQEGEHSPSCAFVRAKAYLAARAAQKG